MANIFGLGDFKNDPPRGGGGPPGGGGFPGGGGGGPPGGGFPGFGGAPKEPEAKRIKNITSQAQFNQELSSAQGLVVVDWTASWCQPCKRIFPILVELSEKYQDVVFLKVDVDMMRTLANIHNINAMPTFHFFKNSQKVDEIQGADPAGLEQKINEHHVKVKTWGGVGRSLKDDDSQPSPVPVQVNQPPVRPNVRENPASNVQPLEQFLEMLTAMGFSHEVSSKALIAINNRSLEDAIDWIDAHPQENQASSDVPSASVPQQAQPNDPMVVELDDEEAADLAALLAAKNASKKSVESGGEANSENTTPVTSESVTRPDDQKTVVELSWEERQRKMEERLAEAKAARLKREEEEDRQRELNRISNSAAATKIRRDLEEKRRQDEVNELKRKKAAEKKAKDEILEKIRLAKEERTKNSNPQAQQTPPPASKPAEVPKANPGTPTVYTECALAIRLPTGETVKHTFSPDETLQTVHDYLVNNGKMSRGFQFIVNYPRKVYSSANFSTTLKQAELVPRGALSVQK